MILIDIFFEKSTTNKLLIAVTSFFSVCFFSSCLDMSTPISDSKPLNIFNQKINVENYQKSYSIGDTLWVNALIPDSMVNSNTGQMEVLSNATFIFSGELYLLMPVYDSLRFLDNNFDIVISEGTYEYINVIDGNYSTYMFSIKFGKPADSNKIRFGIVPKYLGDFSFEATTKAYYGEERTDYNDFSQDNEVGYVFLNFNSDDVNSDVYYSLPTIYRQSYDNYYTLNAINAKQFFFIDVTNIVNR